MEEPDSHSPGFGNLSSLPQHTMTMTESQQQAAIEKATRSSVRVQAKRQTMEEIKGGGGSNPMSQSVIQGQSAQMPQQKRTKERTIQEIIEKVSLWRKLYNGVNDNEGNLLRYSLEDAAQKVGVSKKSLDDYLLQLRFGKKFGFDFQKHKDDKVGILRSSVKKEKSKAKGSGKAGSQSNKGASDEEDGEQ